MIYFLITEEGATKYRITPNGPEIKTETDADKIEETVRNRIRETEYKKQANENTKCINHETGYCYYADKCSYFHSNKKEDTYHSEKAPQEDKTSK